jgi:anti-sigma factor RsiW
MTAKERFDELVSDYLDEALNDEAMTELSTLLATRAEYATRFVMLSRLHGALRDLLDRGPAPKAAKSPRWILWAVVMAILAAILALLTLALRP